ncbi:MAG: hypothetical protein C4519_07295 [Desulfobacteraceae bacterium]|nr:MAG: hypothetical protein C4519_07295 [Desulfobacteraceae bacterium]
MICKSAPNPKVGFHSITELGREDERALFQPLYPCLPGTGGDASVEAEQQTALLLKEAREKGFQRGFQSGQAEARSMLKSSLAPGLKAFIKSYSDLTVMEEQIRERACTNMTELSLAIAERILDEPVCMALERLHAVILRAWEEANRFSLNTHPEDLLALRTILPEAGLKWSSRLDLLIRGNGMQRSEVRVETQAGPQAFPDEQILQAFSEILSEIPASASS